jgi:uncharacterized membrane protein YeaQ/YmgE (transglycosylase-associated protein family)
MNVTLSSVVIWLLIGLIAGWLAGQVTKGSGFGMFGDIIIGIVGAVVGGFVLGALGVNPGGFIGEVIQAFIGALVFLAVASLVSSRRVG